MKTRLALLKKLPSVGCCFADFADLINVVMAESKSPPRSRSAFRGILVDVLVAIFGCGVVILHLFSLGISAEYDSAVYIHGARSLMAGDGYIDFLYGVPVVYWPPMYSVLLAVATFGVFDPMDVAGWLNAILFGLTLYIVARLLRNRMGSATLRFQLCICVAVGWPLVYFACHVMSETAFVFFTTAALAQADRALRGLDPKPLLFAAFFTDMACLTRHIGVAVFVAICLLLVLQGGVALRAKVIRVGVYVVVASAGPCALALRSVLRTGTVTGDRTEFVRHAYTDALQSIGGTIEHWIVPDLPIAYSASSAANVTWVVVVALASFVVATGVFLSRNPTPAKHVDGCTFSIFGIYVLSYSAALYVASFKATFNIFQMRYSVPLYLPACVVVLLAFDVLLARPWAGRRAGQALRTILVFLLGLWIAWQLAINFVLANNRTLGYVDPAYRDSQILRHVQHSVSGGTLFSNDAAIAYLNTRLPEVNHRSLPCKATATRPRLLTASEVGEVHVLWLPRRVGKTCVETSQFNHLLSMRGLKTVSEKADGVLFRFSPS